MDAKILTPGNTLVPAQLEAGNLATATFALPSIITSAGEDAVTRFVEYFTARIRNPHTRRAYFRNAIDFLRWCEDRGIHDLKSIKPVRVAAYIEQLQQNYAKPSVKQQLATIRMLFDWLVTGQVISVNPAHAVRGPKHVVTTGKTPVLTAEETRDLLDSIKVKRIIGTDPEGNDITGPDVIGLSDVTIGRRINMDEGKSSAEKPEHITISMKVTAAEAERIKQAFAEGELDQFDIIEMSYVGIVMVAKAAVKSGAAQNIAGKTAASLIQGFFKR